jgi:radical SAM enzyme (TIGR01210 family)
MAAVPSIYPVRNADWDKWILDRRPQRPPLDPWRPYAFSIEDECSISGEVVPVATTFLTNRECPWRCLMCDLWRNTLTAELPAGAIPAQIDYALSRLSPARQIKLYNSGSFFDPRAIPVSDYPAIAGRLNCFDRVIVESHPALLGESCLRLRDLVKGSLEVAIGLETVHPEILRRLNKRMTLEQFSTAAEWLLRNEIDLRVFILVKPPFMDEEEALHWAERSLDFAFDCGAGAASLIPTRAGNGALDELAARGEFSAPRMETLEAAANYGLGLKRGRVFADLWDIQQVPACSACREKRVSRLREMNLRQTTPPPVKCVACGDGK